MELTFYHFTDTHYYSHRHYEGDPFALPQYSDQIAMRESPEIVSAAFDAAAADKDAPVVIITGDLTHQGDEDSHAEMVSLLHELEDRGKQVWVITDFHDYPGDNFGFTFDREGKQHPNKAMSKEDVLRLYAPFSTDKALSVYEDGLSYVAQLPCGVRFLAMSSSQQKNGPSLTDDYMRWVGAQAVAARADGQTMIAGIHPPFICPSPVYGIIGRGNVVCDYEKRGGELADMGIRLMLSGHSHIQDIDFVTSPTGYPFYDVTTASLVGYPPRYRRITLDTEKMTADVKTLVPEPSLCLGMSLDDYCKRGFLGSIEKIPDLLEHNVAGLSDVGGVSLPTDKLLEHEKLVNRCGHFLNGLTFGRLGRFTRRETGLKSEDYAEIKDKKVMPYIIDAVAGLYRGNGCTDPDSAEFAIAMGTIAALDSFIRLLHIDLRKKIGYDTLTQVIEPLICNNGIDDDNAILDLRIPPENRPPLRSFRSTKAERALIPALLIIIVLLPLWLAAAAAAGTAKLIGKTRKRHVN